MERRVTGAGGRRSDRGAVWVQLHRDLRDAEVKTLLLQAASHLLGRLVEDAGGVLQAASLLGNAAVCAARDGRPCVLVLDDVWDGRLVPALLSELRGGATGGRSRTERESLLLFSTRSAAMAAANRDIVHLPLDRMSAQHGLQVLAAAVAGGPCHPPTWATEGERAAAEALVEYAAGHPLTLSVAGALARTAMAADDHGGRLTEALEQLRYKLQAIEGGLGPAYGSRYPSLWASMTASYEGLPPAARAQYRALAVMRSRGRLPLVALGALWGVPAGAALAIAKVFANASMAALRPGVAGARAGAGAVGGPTLELHDIQKQYVTELCAELDGGVAAAHEALLQGYARVYGLEPSEQVHPWWTVVREDTYLRGELCRHLAAAGRSTELRRLLHTWAYVEAQVCWGEPPAPPSTAGYVADCDLEGSAWAVAAVVEGAALRGGAEQVMFELDARFSAAVCDADDGRSALLARLLDGVRAARSGRVLRVLGPQTVLVSPLVRRFFPNASPEVDGAGTGDGRPVGVSCMAALPPSPRCSNGGSAGQRVAVGGMDGCVRVFNLATGAVTAQWRVADSPVERMVAVAGGVVNEHGAALPAVVTISSSGALHVWALDPPVVVHVLCQGDSGSERELCVAVLDQLADRRSDGTALSIPGPVRVVTGSEDGSLRIWDVRQGTLETVLRGIPYVVVGPLAWLNEVPQVHPICEVAVVTGGGDVGGCGDGGRARPRRVVAMTSDSHVFVWGEARDGWELERELPMDLPRRFPFLCLMGAVAEAGVAGGGAGTGASTACAAPTVAVVPDVSAHGGGFGALVGRDVLTGRHVCRVAAPQAIKCAALLRRGAHGRGALGRALPTVPSVLACGDDTGGLALWDPSASGLSARVGAHKGSVTALVVVDSSDGPAQPPVLVSASRDGTVAVWDKALGDRAGATSGTVMNEVLACVVGGNCVTGSLSGLDAQDGDPDGGGTALVCTSNIEGFGSVSVHQWTAARDAAVVLSPLPAGIRINMVATAPMRLSDGRCAPLVAVVASRRLWMWQGATAEAVELDADTPDFVRIIPGGDADGGDDGPSPLVVSLTCNGAGHVWDGRTRCAVAAIVPPFPLERCTFTVVGVAPAGGKPGEPAPPPPLIVGCCADAGLVIWDAMSGRHLHTLGDSHPDVVASAVPADGRATLPGGRRAVVSAAGAVATVWDVDAGVSVATLDSHAGRISAVCAFAAGSAGDAGCASTPAPLTLTVVTVELCAVLRVWTVGGLAPGVAAAATPPTPRALPFPGENVFDVHVLDAARGLIVAHLSQAVAVVDVASATVAARVSLLGRVDSVAVVGPTALAVVTEGSLVRLALRGGAAS